MRAEPIPDALRELGAALAVSLGPWFERAHRDMSWRRTQDPYGIWVSEIMLQQTRVETVERYWGTFMERFPTVEELAAADAEAVLEAWSGLGYYRRARLLHRGARHVVDRLGGVLPQDAAALRDIPGIGPYTAGAISSIAFDRPAALVDGNVARVFSRVRGISDPRDQAADAAGHWQLARAVVEAGRPRVVAQALMELGAVVCTPRDPDCPACPVRGKCRAHRDGTTGTIPAPRTRTAQPLQGWSGLAVVSRRRLLLVRRPAQGLLAGMWCLPLVPGGGRGPSQDEIAAVLGAMPRVSLGAPLPKVRHVFTHRIWEVHPVRIDAPRRVDPVGVPADDCAWVAPGERPAGGVPTITAKLLERLGWSRPRA